MLSTFFFLSGTLLLSLNFIRPFGLAISDWLYFISLGLALLETIFIDRKSRGTWTNNRFLWFGLLILIGGIISLAKSKNINVAVFEIIQQIYVITFFISLIWIMVKRGQTRNILLALILTGVFTSCIASIDYITGSRLGLFLSGTPNEQFWYRYAGTLGHPNKFGYFLVITTTITFARLMKDEPLRKISLNRMIWFLLLFMQIFGLYLSGSLTAYIGILLSIILLFISRKAITWRALKIAIPVLLVCYLIVSLGIITSKLSFPQRSQLGNSLISKAIMRVETTTAPSRLIIFEHALEEIIKNPLVGAGYDQISTSGIGFITRDLHGTIHNVFLQVLYAGGLLAFIGWSAVYAYLGWIAIVTLFNREKKGVSLMILGIAVSAITIIIMDQFQDAIYQREKWLIFGLLVSYTWEQIVLKRTNKQNHQHIMIKLE